MKRTQLPPWISPAPPNWGTSERGKLSADQWRVLCTVHLPITLVHLWENETGRKKELLQNFMHLVTAVRIANMRVSSPIQVQAYHRTIKLYVEGIKELFPYDKLKPVVHAAFHVGDGLELFGPTHSHSAPFYERYINFLHGIKTNGKIGAFCSHASHSSSEAWQVNWKAHFSGHPRAVQTFGQFLSMIRKYARWFLRWSRQWNPLTEKRSEVSALPIN